MHGLLTNLEKAALLTRDDDLTHGRVLAEVHRVVAMIEDRMIASLGIAALNRMAVALTKCADDLLSSATNPS